jgi:hypothetical protein
MTSVNNKMWVITLSAYFGLFVQFASTLGNLPLIYVVL